MEFWKALRDKLGLGGNSEVAEDIGDTIDQHVSGKARAAASLSAQSSDPEIRKVSPMLDLIGHTEGTTKGRGYNETLAYGKLTGGDVDLVSMTLDEIDSLQTKMLRHPGNKWNSSALGQYQIVRTTRRRIQKKMGLSGDEKFTPELQDRMALELLKGRGLDKWLAGRMSDRVFMNNISKEWASLPRHDGKGTYSGQRTGTDVNGVLSTFAAIRDSSSDNSALGAIEAATSSQVYANIPERERHQFLQWNSDPVKNHEANLKSIDPTLADVVREAEKDAGTLFVVGSGKRDKALQRKAVQWGWSKTMDSDHLDGSAVDLWPIDENGAVIFDKGRQMEIVRAMKAAAKKLGVDLDIGAEWKSFKDLPHFAIRV